MTGSAYHAAIPTATPTMMAGRALAIPPKSFLKNLPKLKWPLGSMRFGGLFST